VTIPIVSPLPKLERPAFFGGQLLGPDDLEAVYAYHREARRLHNRTLHNWGIALGLGATGMKGARQVTVAPGYALDCEGRDLILTESVTLPVPTIAGLGPDPVPYYLTASFIEDQELERTESRKGVCEGDGVVRRVETLRIRWQRPTDLTPASRYRRGLDLILASAGINGCALAADLETAGRRYVSSSPRPYLAVGSTPEGATNWTFFSSGVAVLGVRTQVDTSASGFERTPSYQAHLVGSRVLAAQNRVFDGLVSVVNPSSTGFTLQVAMPRNLGFPPYIVNPPAAFTPALLDTLRTELRWSVVWLGIEA
jgi:hypothetical protein